MRLFIRFAQRFAQRRYAVFALYAIDERQKRGRAGGGVGGLKYQRYDIFTRAGAQNTKYELYNVGIFTRGRYARLIIPTLLPLTAYPQKLCDFRLH